MNTGAKEPNAPSPDRFMERDVNDLRVTVGKFEERISNLKENTVTREQLATELSETKIEAWKHKAEIWRLAVTLIVPILAASVGAFAIILTGMVRLVSGS